MTIFSEFYNRLLNFFNKEDEKETAKDTACNRLKLVLMQDRAKMEPALMEQMREELIEVISKYVEMDTDALDLALEADGEAFALMLNIPVIRTKTREEVEDAEEADEDDEDNNNNDSEEINDSDDNYKNETDTSELSDEEQNINTSETPDEMAAKEDNDKNAELETGSAENSSGTKSKNRKKTSKKKVKHQKNNDE